MKQIFVALVFSLACASASAGGLIRSQDLAVDSRAKVAADEPKVAARSVHCECQCIGENGLPIAGLTVYAENKDSLSCGNFHLEEAACGGLRDIFGADYSYPLGYYSCAEFDGGTFDSAGGGAGAGQTSSLGSGR